MSRNLDAAIAHLLEQMDGSTAGVAQVEVSRDAEHELHLMYVTLDDGDIIAAAFEQSPDEPFDRDAIEFSVGAALALQQEFRCDPHAPAS